MEQQLIEALIHRKDRFALEIIKKHPELISENVIRLALDNGCIRVIRYLRAENKITPEGKALRDEERRNAFDSLLSEASACLPEIKKYFKG